MSDHVYAILSGTGWGWNQKLDHDRAMAEFREAERELEVLPFHLRHLLDDTNSLKKRQDALQRAYTTYAKAMAALVDATGRVYPLTKREVGQAYARVLSDLLLGKQPDSKNLWAVVWAAPYADSDVRDAAFDAHASNG